MRVDGEGAAQYLPATSSPSMSPAPIDVKVATVDVFVIRPLAPEWRVLVLQRAAATRCPASWETVHGRIEAGELPEQAAVREVQEETGLAVARLYNITVQPFYLPSLRIVTLAVVFAAFVDEPADVVLGAEHGDSQWLSPKDADARYSWPRSRVALREIVDLLRDGQAGPVEDVVRVV
jgi:8-oxo-dGTP pyrophosphatase MutT (NUDIX family)